MIISLLYQKKPKSLILLGFPVEGSGRWIPCRVATFSVFGTSKLYNHPLHMPFSGGLYQFLYQFGFIYADHYPSA